MRQSLKSKLIQKSLFDTIRLSSSNGNGKSKSIPIVYRKIDNYIYQITFMQIPTETTTKRYIFAYTLKGDTAKDIFTVMHHEYQRGGNTFKKATEMCWMYKQKLNLIFQFLDVDDSSIEVVAFVITSRKPKLWSIIKTNQNSLLAISEDNDLLIPDQKTRYKRVARKLLELKQRIELQQTKTN